MAKTTHFKPKSLYIGCYDFEDCSHSNWHTFIYSSHATDDELEKYFRRVVYKDEYGEVLKDASLDIYELREAFESFGRKKRSKL